MIHIMIILKIMATLVDNVECWMGGRMYDGLWVVGGGHPLGDNLHWKSFPNTPIFCWEGKSAKSLTFVWQSPLMPFKTTNTLTNKQANDDHCVGIAFFCKGWQNRLNSLISPWRPEKFQSKGKRKVNISGCKKESRLPRYKALKLHDTSLHFSGSLNFLTSQKCFSLDVEVNILVNFPDDFIPWLVMLLQPCGPIKGNLSADLGVDVLLRMNDKRNKNNK